MYKLSFQNVFKFIFIILIIINSSTKLVLTVKAAVVAHQPLHSAVEKCRQETGATEADFDDLLKKINPPSMAVKCIRACLMKQFALMDENGKFNRNVALHTADVFVGTDAEKMRIATEIVDACYTMEVSENHCEAAEQYGKCANKQVKASRAHRQKRSTIHDEFLDAFLNGL